MKWTSGTFIILSLKHLEHCYMCILKHVYNIVTINKAWNLSAGFRLTQINLWTLGGVPVFLPSDQLSGSPCRTQVLVIRDFATTCTCTCQHYYAIFMHSACIHVQMHMYALCGYTRHCVLGMRLYTSLRTCRYAAIHVNRPSGISQAAAIAAKRTQGVNDTITMREIRFSRFHPADSTEMTVHTCTWFHHKPTFNLVISITQSFKTVILHWSSDFPVTQFKKTSQTFQCLSRRRSLFMNPGFFINWPGRSMSFL